MQRLLKKISIKKKLVVIIAGITFFTLAAGFVFVSVYGFNEMKESLAAATVKNAELMGEYSIVPLTFADGARAEKNLSVLRKIPNVQKAVIYDDDGSVFARYEREDARRVPPMAFHSDFDGFQNGFYHVFRPIVRNGVTYGTVYLAASTRSLIQDITRNVIIFTISLFILSGVAALLALIFQNAVTAPILRLAEVMERITREPDYATRVSKASEDEIGMLYDGFNSMLERIEKGQKELKAERDFSTGIITGTQALICGIAADGITTFINPAGEQVTGYRKNEIIGKNWWKTLCPGVDYRQVEKLFRDFANTDVRDYEISLTRKDGLKKIISWNSVTQADDDGQVEEVIGFAIDITERKNAEEELRHLRNYLGNIIDSMPSVIVGVDTEGRVTQWNREAENQTGLKAEEAAGRSITEVLPRMALEWHKIEAAMRELRPQETPKVPRQTGGETRYENVIVYPLRANGVEGAVIRIDDVSERVRLEDMMIQSEKMMSVGGLAAGMAHEINNPLAGIIQNAEMVERRLTEDIPPNREAAEAAGLSLDQLRTYMESRRLFKMLANIRKSGNRAAEIVQNMLSFARKSDSYRTYHDLNALLDKSLALAETDYDLKRRYDFRQIQIRREYDPQLPKVRCERSKIQQVFLNILKNSAEAMSSVNTRPPRFVLRTLKDGGMARVEIEDNGPGMDEATRKRVFEPFFTTKPVGEGTGLGMSVSYFIITENHDGEMAVESTPGHGAKFIVRLPAG